MSRWTREDRERFRQHAAPEAIKAELDIARAAKQRADEFVSWLEVQLARRCKQVAEGTWPPECTEGE